MKTTTKRRMKRPRNSYSAVAVARARFEMAIEDWQQAVSDRERAIKTRDRVRDDAGLDRMIDVGLLLLRSARAIYCAEAKEAARGR